MVWHAAVVATKLTFRTWPPDPRYIEVVGDKVSCTDETAYVKQIDADSVLLEGASYGPVKPLADYGNVSGKDDLIYRSGMFIPEVNPCWRAAEKRDRNGEKCAGYPTSWNGWLNDTMPDQAGVVACSAKAPCTLEDFKTYGITHLKYNPAGALNLRESGSAQTNSKFHKEMGRLGPRRRHGKSAPYDAYNLVSRAMWGKVNPTNCTAEDKCTTLQSFPFSGMMQMLSPVYDSIQYDGHPGYGSNGTQQVPAQQRIVLKRCPNAASDTCCVALEGDPEPTGTVKNMPLTAQFNASGRHEYRLRWKYDAVHTSFSRAVPDLSSYQDATLKNDFERAQSMRFVPDPSPPPLSDLTKLRTGGPTGRQTQYLKCRADLGAFTAATGSTTQTQTKTEDGSAPSSNLAKYFEHFYVALVGHEEQLALSQPHTFEEYDLRQFGKTFCKGSANVDECAKTEYDAICSKMPGGHCGHGYSCNDDEATSGHLAHDLVTCATNDIMFKKGNGSTVSKYDYMRSSECARARARACSGRAY